MARYIASIDNQVVNTIFTVRKSNPNKLSPRIPPNNKVWITKDNGVPTRLGTSIASLSISESFLGVLNCTSFVFFTMTCIPFKADGDLKKNLGLKLFCILSHYSLCRSTTKINRRKSRSFFLFPLGFLKYSRIFLRIFRLPRQNLQILVESLPCHF